MRTHAPIGVGGDRGVGGGVAARGDVGGVQARGVVGAWTTGAFVDVHVTELARPSWRAYACEVVDGDGRVWRRGVDATCVVLARRGDTFIVVNRAVIPCPTCYTVTNAYPKASAYTSTFLRARRLLTHPRCIS